MRPILLKGHERSITCVQYNRDGDLIFTAAKDNIPTLWLAETGERIGTYEQHNGAVWHLDVAWDSKLLVSGSADMSAKVWAVETGVELAAFEHTGPVRSCQFDESGRRVLTMCDAFGGLDQGRPPLVRIYENDPMWGGDDKVWRRSAEFKLPHPEAGEVKCQLVRWLPQGKTIVCAFEDGAMRVMDALTFEELRVVEAHDSKITSISWNPSQTLMLTTSADQTAKLWDVAEWKMLKKYLSDRPLNAGAISPLKEHVIVGGGQDAMSVTTTAGRAGRFETQFFHTIYEDEFGRVKGHFGPINTLAIAPDGKSYCSGGEDGYARLHHFDDEYIDMADPVPDDDPEELLAAAATAE
ncbi:WD40-repeat-containing domain protein [Pelagophyceae sp. CCMP2097]|nr:WD40-repeat-containing domain protein [Pelagophyceae sp. CCMP2097]|mmetsp:Transcript_19451/g.65719  ORF Transcript_19451/g.65719 Transcript_19451/m.65719 type:complete len:353 (+) Transcript_19451:61-1119(+)